MVYETWKIRFFSMDNDWGYSHLWKPPHQSLAVCTSRMGLTKLQASILSSWYCVPSWIMSTVPQWKQLVFLGGLSPFYLFHTLDPRQIHRTFAWSLIEHHFSFCGNMPGSSLLAFGNSLERPMIAHVDHPFWGKIMSHLCAAQKI